MNYRITLILDSHYPEWLKVEVITMKVVWRRYKEIKWITSLQSVAPACFLKKIRIVLIITIAVLNALTDYDLYVVEQIMSSTITKSVLNSAFGQGSRHLHAYCEEIKTCNAESVLHSLTETAKRIVLFQGFVNCYLVTWRAEVFNCT